MLDRDRAESHVTESAHNARNGPPLVPQTAPAPNAMLARYAQGGHGHLLLTVGAGADGVSNRAVVRLLRSSSQPDEIALTQDLGRSTGRPLPDTVRAPLEAGLGYPLDRAAVHTDSVAATAAEQLGAEAFTIGSDIYFGAGRYEPDSDNGFHLLAHEAVHVVQAGAPAVAPPGPLVLGSATAAAEAEAGSMANLLARSHRTGPPVGPVALAGSGPAAPVIRRQERGDRGAVPGREEDRETRTSRAYDDDDRRGRQAGGSRSRRGDPFVHLDSDWAGRSILERYLGGEGAWDIRDDSRWTAYLRESRLLRGQLRWKAFDIAHAVAAVGKDGVFPVHEVFHAELENGEGIIGYQYLHGTNKTVGDFDISGVASVAHHYGESTPDQISSEQPGTAVELTLLFVWNDMIDMNANYISDIVKNIGAEIISLGEAEGYRLSIGWHDDCRVWLPETGGHIMVGYPGP